MIADTNDVGTNKADLPPSHSHNSRPDVHHRQPSNKPGVREQRPRRSYTEYDEEVQSYINDGPPAHKQDLIDHKVHRLGMNS